MIFLNKKDSKEQLMKDKVEELAYKRNITFAEARKLLTSGQSFLK